MQISGIQLQPGSVIKNAAVESGSVFPVNPGPGRIFRLESGIEDHDPGLYTFNGTQWITGDISAVTAGAGLLGGGSSGAVALRIDTAVVATLEHVAQVLRNTSRSYATDTDLVLGSASAAFQALSTTQDYCVVILPDATTLVGSGLAFTLHNVGQYAFGVRDASGSLRAVLGPRQMASVYCSDRSTAAGKWHVGNITYDNQGLGSSVLGAGLDVSPLQAATSKYTAIAPLTATTSLAVYLGESSTLTAVILSTGTYASTSSGVPTTLASNVFVTNVAVCALSSTSVLAVYQSGTSSSAGPYTLYAVSIKITAGGLSVSSPITLGNTTASNNTLGLTCLTASKAVCVYSSLAGFVRSTVIDVVNIGLTIVKGSPYDVTSTLASWGSISTLSATRALCVYQGNNGSYLNASVLNIASTTITVGPQTVVGGVPVRNTSVTVLGTSRALAIYSGDNSPPLPVPPINLRSAAGFAIFSNTSVANVGVSSIMGNIGVAPGATVTGFETSSIVGTTNVNDATAVAARADLGTAYTEAQALVSTKTSAADFIGLVLEPGVYSSAAAAGLTGVCTLDGKGDPNAFFVFKIGGAWAQAAATSFVLVNAANARNVYWQVTGAISLGAGASFVGTALAGGAITAGAGSKIQGRMLGLSTVSIDSTTISAAVAPRKPALQSTILSIEGDVVTSNPAQTLAEIDCAGLAATALDTNRVACLYSGLGLDTDALTRNYLVVLELSVLNSTQHAKVLEQSMGDRTLCNGSGIARLNSSKLLCSSTSSKSNLFCNTLELVGG